MHQSVHRFSQYMFKFDNLYENITQNKIYIYFYAYILFASVIFHYTKKTSFDYFRVAKLLTGGTHIALKNTNSIDYVYKYINETSIFLSTTRKRTASFMFKFLR